MIHPTFCLLAVLGKAGDWITIVVMAVGFIVWLIAQLAGQGANKANQRRREPQRRQPTPPPRRTPPRRPTPPPRPASRAGRRPTPPPRRPTPPPKRPTPPPRSRPASERKIGTLEQKPPAAEKKISSLEEHHLQTTIKPQVAGLPEGTVPSDLQLHVEQTFSHESGQLPSEQRPEAEPHQRPISPVAQEIINMLRDPQDVRKAVVIAEILRRPEI